MHIYSQHIHMIHICTHTTHIHIQNIHRTEAESILIIIGMISLYQNCSLARHLTTRDQSMQRARDPLCSLTNNRENEDVPTSSGNSSWSAFVVGGSGAFSGGRGRWMGVLQELYGWQERHMGDQEGKALWGGLKVLPPGGDRWADLYGRDEGTRRVGDHQAPAGAGTGRKVTALLKGAREAYQESRKHPGWDFLQALEQ